MDQGYIVITKLKPGRYMCMELLAIIIIMLWYNNLSFWNFCFHTFFTHIAYLLSYYNLTP